MEPSDPQTPTIRICVIVGDFFIMTDHPENIPNCFYRISIKALVLDEKGNFLLCRENNGKWELPGGGLDFWENPQDGLTREIKEEMWIDVTFIAQNPSYFVTCFDGKWRANIIYEVQVKDFNFTPSEECEEIWFFTPEEALKLPLFENVVEFCKQYKNIT